jgi:D-alanine-D-alanine ligase
MGIMANIAILFGGRSGEHEVSCASAASVLDNLNSVHEIILVGIDREGFWYLQDIPAPVPDVLKIVAEISRRISVAPGEGLMDHDGEILDIDIVIPVLHGSYGEDGTIQGLLEIARLPYAGSGVLGSAVGMDKDLAKRIWLQEGLPVVPWRTLIAGTDESESSALPERLFGELGTPLFVKPANAGSSVGVSRVDNEDELKTALELAWRHDRKVLVEKAIIGREIECSVMGYSEPEAFPPGEIVPAGEHSFYDYDAKYTDPDGALLKVPADLPKATSEQIRRIAAESFRAVEAGGLARVDFLLEKDSGDIFINEINTMPGMTAISLFPRMTEAGGVNFSAMLERLIEGALEEFAYKEGLSYQR